MMGSHRAPNRNKGLSVDASPLVIEALRRLSKAALIDIVFDAVELAIDAPWSVSVEDVAEFCNPRLGARGDAKVAVPR